MTYGDGGRRLRAPVVELTDLRALERYRPADPGVVAEARRLKEAALLDFGLTESAVASWLYAKCRHQIPTTAVDTAAVVASGEMIRDHGEKFWRGRVWRMWVTDEAGETVCALKLSAER